MSNPHARLVNLHQTYMLYIMPSCHTQEDTITESFLRQEKTITKGILTPISHLAARSSDNLLPRTDAHALRRCLVVRIHRNPDHKLTHHSGVTSQFGVHGFNHHLLVTPDGHLVVGELTRAHPGYVTGLVTNLVETTTAENGDRVANDVTTLLE